MNTTLAEMTVIDTIMVTTARQKNSLARREVTAMMHMRQRPTLMAMGTRVLAPFRYMKHRGHTNHTIGAPA